jgi:hypothetical protein
MSTRRMRAEHALIRNTRGGFQARGGVHARAPLSYFSHTNRGYVLTRIEHVHVAHASAQ